jgi:protein-S-isoprenylcysteine O-methyltransferase Ste14
LATAGLFGIVRNPMYAAWIVFIIPGLVLLTRSWPLLLTPLVAYTAFKLLIRRENEYLEKRFGEDYRKYRAEVNELFPWPRKQGRSD